MELSGKIIKLLPLQTGQGKNGTWKKQEYLLEYGDQYPKMLCFNLWGDKIDQFVLAEGDQVTVHVDVESREFNGKYYTDVKAWRVDKTQGNSDDGGADVGTTSKSGTRSEFGIPAPEFLESSDKDDLPF